MPELTPLLTPEQFQYMSEVYETIRSSAANRTVEERFDFSTVLDGFLSDLEQDQTRYAELLNLYIHVFAPAQTLNELNLDNLNELFNLYLKQRISAKLLDKKAQGPKANIQKVSSNISGDADIYSMTCEQRAEYIRKYRLEGAVNLQQAQDLQNAVLQKTKDIVLDKTLPELYMAYISACTVLAEFSGPHDVAYSIAVESKHQFESAIKQQRLQSKIDAIQPLAELDNIRADVISKDIVKIGVPLSQAIGALRKILVDEKQQLSNILSSKVITAASKEAWQQSLINTYDVLGILNSLTMLISLPARTSLLDRIEVAIDLIAESSKLELIEDWNEKDLYIDTVAKTISRALILSIIATQKLVAGVGGQNSYIPVLIKTHDETYMLEATGLNFAKITSELLNNGDLNSDQLSDFVSWFAVFQRAMSGPSMQTFMSIYTKLQEEYINTLTSEQAGEYQINFTRRYGAEHAEKISTEFDVRMQQFCLDVLTFIEQRIDKLHNKFTL